MDGKGGWGARGRTRSFVIGPSGKARPGTCSRGMIARGKDSRKERLEAVQDRLGRRLLGASTTVAGEAVRGEMGWRKLEERREEKKMLYGRRFWELGEERLVKPIVEKLKESGSIGWREEYEVLLRKYGLEEDEEEESGSVAAWKKKIEKQNWESWQEG